MRDIRQQAWATGGMIFAATMLLIIGIFQILEGIAALTADEFFILAPGYAYEVTIPTWGWIHLIVGAIMVVTGLFLYTGMMWARIVGVVIAGISAIEQFFFLPYFPLWSLLIIAVNVFIIWAITTARPGALAAMEERMIHGGGAGEYPQTRERWPTAGRPGGRDWEAEAPKPGRAPAEEPQQVQETGAQWRGHGMRQQEPPRGQGPQPGR